MIDIQFRECCRSCPNIDVSYDQTRGFGEVVTVIGCTHACVCGAYLVAEESTDLPDRDVTIRGFCDADG